MEKERRYDIDWIRVLAFDILILYHVGMFFVPWGWHIKNNQIVDWLTWPMLFVNQWRLPILFVVSGMGTRFAFSSRSASEYIKERTVRLIIPLMFGILLLVPPQVYAERLVQGKTDGSFFAFYPEFFTGVYPNGNFSWHHLWFLPYLYLMSLVATPLFIRLRKGKTLILPLLDRLLRKFPAGIYVFIVPLFLVEVFLEPLFPVNNALVNDWYAISRYMLLFVYGFILISLGDSFWTSIVKIKWISLLLGISLIPVTLWLWYNAPESILVPLAKTIQMWCWILVIFAFASIYLNRKSRVIEYRNKAVYPFYILHQTITVIIGYWLITNPMHYSFKFAILVAGTFGLSWLLYEFIIRRNRLIAVLFGLKRNNTDGKPQN